MYAFLAKFSSFARLLPPEALEPKLHGRGGCRTVSTCLWLFCVQRIHTCSTWPRPSCYTGPGLEEKRGCFVNSNISMSFKGFDIQLLKSLCTWTSAWQMCFNAPTATAGLRHPITGRMEIWEDFWQSPKCISQRLGYVAPERAGRFQFCSPRRSYLYMYPASH